MPRVRDDDRRIFTFAYLDESGTSERFFASGLLVHGPRVSGADDESLNQLLREAKKASGFDLRADIGWKKIPNKPGKYLDLYRSFVDLFFREPQLSFNSILVDTHEYPLDSRTFFRGSKDRGIDAFSVQLIRCRLLRYWEGGERLHLRFDRRSRPDGVTLLDVLAKLRRIARSEVRTGAAPPTLTARSITGGRHPLVQLADLLVGSVCAAGNGRGGSGGKAAMIQHVAAYLGGSPGSPTSPRTRKFNVWSFRPPSVA
jgi:hypothetical protein